MVKRQICLILDNIRSAHNVGSIFRTADGAGVSKIYICGFSPTPENPKVLKTSLGVEKTMPWEYHKQTWRLIAKLKKQKVKIVALEIAPNAKNIFKYKSKFLSVDRQVRLALIVGNEVRGISRAVLKNADDVVEIPMHGHKESLNVSVAVGVGLYQLLY